MMALFTLLVGCLLLLAEFPSASSETYCLTTESLNNKILSCFLDEGLDPHHVFTDFGHEQSQVHNFFHMIKRKDVHEIMCSQRSVWKRAAQCMMDRTRKCTPKNVRYILPDSRHVAQAVDVICDEGQDANFICSSARNKELFRCGREKGREYARSGGDLHPSSLTCFVWEASASCQRSILAPCGCATSKLFSDISLNTYRPSSCPKSKLPEVTCPHDQEQWSHTASPPIGEHHQISHQDVDCQSSTSPLQAMYQCFINEGIFSQQIAEALDDGHRPKNNFLNSFKTNGTINKIMCRYGHRASFIRAAICTVDLARKCMPAEFKVLYPPSDKIRDSIVYTCNHVQDMNFECIKAREASLKACTDRKIRAYAESGSDSPKLACIAFTAVAECEAIELATCGCSTIKVYSEVGLILLPDFCPRDISRIACDRSQPYRFVGGPGSNGAAKPLAETTLWMLALGALLAVRRLVQ